MGAWLVVELVFKLGGEDTPDQQLFRPPFIADCHCPLTHHHSYHPHTISMIGNLDEMGQALTIRLCRFCKQHCGCDHDLTNSTDEIQNILTTGRFPNDN